MANQTTGIAWATGTSNPFKGCTQCSPECDHCYAVSWATRHQAMRTPGYEYTVENGRFTGNVGVVQKEFDQIRRVRGERIFINSMSDTFHAAVSEENIHTLFAAMAANTNGTNFLICTKRAARLAKMAPALPIKDNMWIGVTAGCKKSLTRLDHLRKVKAAIRWVSVEPMLEELDLTPWLADGTLQWVVVGGESKKGWRPMKREWAQSILVQCRQYGVPFFLKQWSAFNPKTDVEYPPTLQGRVWHEFPLLRARPSDNSKPAHEKGGKDPKRVAAAHKAWETMRARKAFVAASNENSLPDRHAAPQASEENASGATETPEPEIIPGHPSDTSTGHLFLPSPVKGGDAIRVPTSLLEQLRHGTDALSYPRTKHVFWFERERLNELRHQHLVAMIRETSEAIRSDLYEQIKEIELYDAARPKISPRKWFCFRRSNAVDKEALIDTLNSLLTGLFSVTGGTIAWNGKIHPPYLWVQQKQDATLLRLKDGLEIDGIFETLELVQKVAA